jgi:uncharacterized peroxidase-related enzyme
MSFLRTIPPDAAAGPVREMYDRVQAENGYIPNWAQAFSLRPAVRDGWVALIGSIRPHLSVRRYELATLAAARALRSTYCSLAHSRVLLNQLFDAESVKTIFSGDASTVLEPAEVAMMSFVEKVVRGADRITQGDVDQLRAHGFDDAEIFDLVATAAARCFFSKLLDGLGVQADARYTKLEPDLLSTLTVGRPVATAAE